MGFEVKYIDWQSIKLKEFSTKKDSSLSSNQSKKKSNLTLTNS